MGTQTTKFGAVAAGHSETADAAAEVLMAGGNAYDAIIAAHFTACVAEPVLASLGGGGFLLAQTANQQQLVLDFFVQTPLHKKAASDSGFRPIVADFGETRQEFHIGPGSIATPGSVKGLFELHRRLGRMPVMDLVQPAIILARQGVRLNDLQAYIYGIIEPILRATPCAAEIFSNAESGQLLQQGDLQRMPELADTLEALALEGDGLFYRGEIAQRLAALSDELGGHLGLQDMEAYQVICREPLRLSYRGTQIATNPPPSSGGILVAFALQLLDSLEFPGAGFGSMSHLSALLEAMDLTNKARLETHIDQGGAALTELAVLDPQLLARYRTEIANRAHALRGTTHISVMDRQGNVASMTLSNGEGCGHILPGTGVMLNNMLGEEDLHPGGFHQWQENQRMTSMMAPTLLGRPDGQCIALGSGGSNRIRTALLQTVVNLVDFEMPLQRAISSPRMHYENELLNIESGFGEASVEQLVARAARYKVWADKNLFFGGVHGVTRQRGNFDGAGDRRRGGVCRIL